MSEMVEQLTALTVGGATVDVILPVSDSSQVLDSKQDVPFINFSAGGGAINAATVLAKLGRNVTSSCAIGDDSEGELLCAKLNESGVSLTGIEVIQKGKTGRAVISIAQNGDVSICADRGANMSLSGRALQYIGTTDLLYISSIPDPVVDHIVELLDRAKSENTCVAYNPGLSQIRSCRSTFKTLLARTSILLMNTLEARAVLESLTYSSTQKSAAECCLRLSHLLSAQICITDGENGVWVGAAGNLFHQPAIGERVASTVGAGDTFGATFAHFFARNYTSKEAAYWATLNAGACLSAYDAVSGTLSEDTLMMKCL